MTKDNHQVLEILSMTYNDAHLGRDHHPAHTLLPIVLDVAAIEVLEGKAKSLTGGPYTGEFLSLDIDLEMRPEHAWRVWLENCDISAVRPEMIWRRDDSGDRGPVHAAITKRVEQTIDATRDQLPYMTRGMLKLRGRIQGVSMHRKLALTVRRSALLADMTGIDNKRLTQTAAG